MGIEAIVTFPPGAFSQGVPDHQWDGTKLRLKNPDGSWGDYVDLQATEPPPPPVVMTGRPEIFQDDDENDWNLPVNILPPGVTDWRHIFQIQINPALKAGDYIEVAGTAQIRLDAPYNTEFVTKITLTPGYPYYAEDLWGYNGAAGVGYFIKKLAGHNVDPQEHYFTPTLFGGLVVPANMPNSILTVGIRCRSTAAGSAGVNTATILRGYGGLVAKVWRA